MTNIFVHNLGDLFIFYILNHCNDDCRQVSSSGSSAAASLDSLVLTIGRGLRS